LSCPDPIRFPVVAESSGVLPAGVQAIDGVVHYRSPHRVEQTVADLSAAIEAAGAKIWFHGVAMKPGKPTLYATMGRNRHVFGLPGNPVSAFIAFENFVRPVLGRLRGFSRPDLPRIKGVLLRDMKQSPGRTAFLPARVRWESDGWKIEPLPWRGSADIIGFSRANAAVIFPADRTVMKSGEDAESMLFPDYLQRLQIN